MDVLARLATEEPDLSGLAPELTELITSCMERSPGLRPTSSQMLARLGHFAEDRAEEHSYLPESAMALIGDYQRNPLLASGQAGPGEPPVEDATSASYTELPASYKPPARRRPARPSRASRSADDDQDRTEPEQRRLASATWRWLTTHLAWVGWASVGAALIAAGVILGASLTSSSNSPSSGTTGTGGGHGPGGPVPPATVCGTQVKIGSKPALCMNQNWTYPHPLTPVVIHGGGVAPGTSVSVTMSEVGPPPGAAPVITPTRPVRLTAGADGTFQVPVARLYSGELPLGMVTVEAAGPGGVQAGTSFIVIPQGAQPPPSG
jgi:hypothetical protein